MATPPIMTETKSGAIKRGAGRRVKVSASPDRLPPPADFLDDDAVVALGFAGAHARLQHVAMHLEHRPLLAELFALIEYHVHVLERLLGAALRRKIPRQHFLALGVHHLGVGRSAFRHREERLWVKPH